MKTSELVEGKKYKVVAEQCFLKKYNARDESHEFRKIGLGDILTYNARAIIREVGKPKEISYVFTTQDGFTGALTMIFEGLFGEALWLSPAEE